MIFRFFCLLDQNIIFFFVFFYRFLVELIRSRNYGLCSMTQSHCTGRYSTTHSLCTSPSFTSRKLCTGRYSMTRSRYSMTRSLCTSPSFTTHSRCTSPSGLCNIARNSTSRRRRSEGRGGYGREGRRPGFPRYFSDLARRQVRSAFELFSDFL